MSSVPTVYLARHGETEWSKSGQHTGRTDLPLTVHGEEAGPILGARLKGITFSRIFSSPLSRAMRTAELAGFAPEVEPDLLEWHYGEFEGKTNAEIRKVSPNWVVFRDGCPGGETPTEITLRVDRLVAKLKGLSGNVLCFAHGHLLRILACRWIDLPVSVGGNLLLGTAALSILSFNHDHIDEPAIKVWNS